MASRSDKGWHISSLRLSLPSMPESEARWISNEIVRRLADLPAPPVSCPQLSIRLPAQRHSTREQIAASIVQQIVEQTR